MTTYPSPSTKSWEDSCGGTVLLMGTVATIIAPSEEVKLTVPTARNEVFVAGGTCDQSTEISTLVSVHPSALMDP